MNRWMLRFFGIGAWANGAWDFNAYFVHGQIIQFLHTWLVLLPIFAIFFGYPIVGLFLIFGKMPFKADLAQGIENIGSSLDAVPDIELEA